MRQDDGYTLIEVLVAFAILSSALLISFESFSGGILKLRHAQDAIEAQYIARYALNVWAGPEHREQALSGKTGAFSWFVKAKRLPGENSASLQSTQVMVRVESVDGKEVTAARLSTVVLTP